MRYAKGGRHERQNTSKATAATTASEAGTDNGQFTVTLDGGKLAGPTGVLVTFSVSGPAAPTDERRRFLDRGILGLKSGYLAGIGGTNVDPELIKRVVHHALEAGEFGDGPLGS